VTATLTDHWKLERIKQLTSNLTMANAKINYLKEAYTVVVTGVTCGTDEATQFKFGTEVPHGKC